MFVNNLYFKMTLVSSNLKISIEQILKQWLYLDSPYPAKDKHLTNYIVCALRLRYKFLMSTPVTLLVQL